MSDVVVRQAVLEDTAAITTIYRSNIPQWINREREAVEYEALSIHERWQHGGPWLSLETCAVWMAHLLQRNEGIPLVAERDGVPVGQAEVFIGHEPEPFGHHINISTIAVHSDCQREGIGQALINYILQMAAVMNCQRVMVAYPDPPEFFAKHDFQPLAARYRVSFPAQEGRVFYRARDLIDDNPAEVKGWFMPMGRFQSSREEWERMRWYIWNSVPALVEAEWKRLHIDLTGQPGIMHLHQHDSAPQSATIRLWTKNPVSPQILTAVRDRAARMGYERLTTIIPESLASMLGVEGGQVQWLYARSV